MEPGNHPADDQRLGIVVQPVFQQLRHRRDCIHAGRQNDNDPVDDQTEPSDQVDGRPSAADEGDPGKAQERPATSLPRDNAPIQRPWRQSSGLPRSDVHTIPNMDRSLPGHPANGAFQPREPRWVVSASVWMDSAGAQGSADRQLVPLDGLGETRPIAVHHANSGWRVDVHNAEDVEHARGGRPAGVDESYDVVDDAFDVRLLHAEFSERARGVLGSFERDWGGDSRVHHRVGSSEISVGLRARHRAGRDGCHGAVVGSTCRGDGNR